jgi:hypothetical protein
MFWTRASWLLLRGSSKGPGRLYSSRKNRLRSAIRCAPPQRTAPRLRPPRARTSRAPRTPPANYSHSRSGDVAHRSATTAPQFASLHRATVRVNRIKPNGTRPRRVVVEPLIHRSHPAAGHVARWHQRHATSSFKRAASHQQPSPHYHHHKDRPRTAPPSARSRQTSRAP